MLPRVHRPEIEGLRAVAALLVASYHLWTGRVSGGVDVFFVVSGFLITTTLFGQLDRGRIRPGAFLGRLARRLLPAALTVLASILLMTWLVLPRSQWARITTEVRASALYYENWQLAASAVDYLAQFSDNTPAQHFWAQSVQGQFYLIWLAVFALVAWAIRGRRHLARPAVTVAFAVLFVVSLAWSVWFTHHDQPLAYYNTWARVWEFTLGGLTAIGLSVAPRLPDAVRRVAGWAGLLGLLATGIVLHVGSVFPGYAALLPGSCAVLIMAGGGAPLSWSATQLLSWRPLVWLGGISYGIYLWHWPLLVAFRETRGVTGNGWDSGLAIIAASILLAWLTNRLIERPVQRASSTTLRRATTALLLAGALAVSGSAAGLAHAQTVRTEEALKAGERALREPLPAVGAEPCFGAGARAPKAHCDQVDTITPAPGSAPQVAQEPCLGAPALPLPAADPAGERYRLQCWLGVPPDQATAKVLLIGDSHSRSLRPALQRLAAAHHWAIASFSSSGCTAAPIGRRLTAITRWCPSWLEDVDGYLDAHAGEFDALLQITASGDHAFTAGDGWETDLADAYRAQWTTHAAHVPAIVVVRDTPSMTEQTVACVEQHAGDASEVTRSCAVPRDRAVLPDAGVTAAREDDDPRTSVIDLTDRFCSATLCPPVIGGAMVYVDDVHLTSVWSSTLAPEIEHQLRGVLPDAVRRRLFPASP